MKKVLIIYSEQKNLPDLASELKAGFKANGYQVELKSVKDRSKPVNFKMYDLVLAGSPVLGFLGGKIDQTLVEFLSDCKGTVGQKTIAFVNTKMIGQTKALKKLMQQLESLGCRVYDFRALANGQAAKNYAERL